VPLFLDLIRFAGLFFSACCRAANERRSVTAAGLSPDFTAFPDHRASCRAEKRGRWQRCQFAGLIRLVN
jgi:hypothetical protein